MVAHDSATTAFAGSGGLSRRAALRGLGGIVAAGALATRAPAAAQEATPAAAGAPFRGRTFVGPTSDAGTFVAVVVAPGREDGREARGYLCDGARINVWFGEGSVDAESLALASEGGATAAGEFAGGGVAGTVTLADGRSFAFEAAPAAGIAGLYEVVGTLDGLVRGASAEGARVDALIARDPLTGPGQVRGRHPIVGFLTAPAGQPRAFKGGLAPDAGPFEGRWIVLPDGRGRGGKKGGSRDGHILVEEIE